MKCLLIGLLLATSLHAQSLPDKPLPEVKLGDLIAPGAPMGDVPDGLVLDDVKEDGKRVWQAKKVGTCNWCGEPMTVRHAMFDKRASSMWILRTALMVTDIELSHHSPCFIAHTCKEGNPLLGQTRAQAYAVTMALDGLTWYGDGWMRAGSKKYRVGGLKLWWIVPLIGEAGSTVGIVSTLARWHQ